MNLPKTIRDNSNILEHMVKDGMLDDVYEEGFGLELVNEYIAGMTAQISHRYPRMNIIEIGKSYFLISSLCILTETIRRWNWRVYEENPSSSWLCLLNIYLHRRVQWFFRNSRRSLS